MRFSTFAAGAVGILASTAAAIPTISVKGSKFFDSNGNQFFVKGVAYQLVPDDPLIDNNQCKLDAALMKELGANSIRVYHVDPSGDHRACMSTFADAGIYLWLDLDTFTTQIEQDKPQWNATQLEEFQKVMDEFQKFDNTAGFFIGNEVLTTGNGSVAAPYVKAATRDLKAYRDRKKYRNIPVGYSAADIATLRPMLQNYLTCGSNSSESIDFFALNAYEWCGQNTYAGSGYSALNAMVTQYPVPIFFSETGCNTVAPRDFGDQGAIFGKDMSPYWSGSIIYEWIEESNHYGLISYGAKVDASSPGAPPDGFPRSGTPIPVQPDFSNLANQWKTVSPSSIKAADYKPTLTPPPCPDATPGVWEVKGNVVLPSVGQTFNSADATKTSSGSVQPSATSTKKGDANSLSVGHVLAGLGGAVAVGFCLL
ncbi:hypothetical protein EJ06DRAFT_495164 [Trichodelitschia bisporula]|uniref:1,3-beta-glucanosyltransferase n=1 Tax=Trichodelitschia bisporula TaxID=703511 RepID=A0A6G1HU47_9PEZI|nr:hypothetical protein EJ06DRAFT_495164 [Trichodelitschia bisporula]